VPSDGPAEYLVEVSFDTGPLAGKVVGAAPVSVRE
jgi:hypothetical protein